MYDLLYFCLVKEFFVLLLHIHDYLSASCEGVFIDFCDLELTRTIGRPHISRLSVDSRNHLDEISNNEGRIKADTKLANDVFLYLTAALFCLI